MHKFIGSRVWRLGIAVILVFTLCGLTVSAQEPDPEGAGTAEVGPPTRVDLDWTAEPPMLTDEQKAQQEYWAERTNLPGPGLAGQLAESVGPDPGTESHLVGEERLRSGQPLLPSDPRLMRAMQFGVSIPGSKSNAMGSSVGIAGRAGFFTGDWFGAHTNDGGKTWSYVNPYTVFPQFGHGQISIYDEARDLYLWLLTGTPDENWENAFKLGVSTDRGVSWYFYPDHRPIDTNAAWTNEWWDHPHIQLGADYAYISWNLYDQSSNWTRSVMLRWPLDDLRTTSGFTYQHYPSSEWFTFVPVQGAYHTMYWASNWPTTEPQNSRIRIWKWQEDEDREDIVFWDKNVAAWTFTDVGGAQCGGKVGNWVYYADQRLLTGARYSINVPGADQEPKILGRKILGWWWNVKQGEGFVWPYIDGAAFYEDTMEQVIGWRGRPYVWNAEHCYAYPSATPNKRQDLGMVFNWAEASIHWKPRIAYAIADDYHGSSLGTPWAPPSWCFHEVRNSRSRPGDKLWGPWNTVREFEPTQKVWVAASHFIPVLGDPCINCAEPIYFVFGRERDWWSWERWRRK